MLRHPYVIYLKIANAARTAQPINIQISGAHKVQPKGELVTLAAASPNDANSIDQPQEVTPRTQKVEGLGADFTREFPAYSFTVLKLKSN
jgi:alpha-N-arabinofuranosidase